MEILFSQSLKKVSRAEWPIARTAVSAAIFSVSLTVTEVSLPFSIPKSVTFAPKRTSPPHASIFFRIVVTIPMS